MDQARTPAYTIMDADTGERFSTTDFSQLDQVQRERHRLAMRYGKESCLVVCSIDAQGHLHEIDIN